MRFFLGLIAFGALLTNTEASIEKDRKAILNTSGCYIVDYNYHEVEALDPSYSLDTREYHSSLNPDFKKFASMISMIDPNTTPETYQLAVKEKIWVRSEGPDQIHLQHIIFLTNAKGELDFLMKHHSERWTYEAKKVYAYAGGAKQAPVELQDNQGQWTREMTALDDSPRYSCSGKWDHSGAYPRWTCSGISPIPGREYRDMQRDYDSLNRFHEITVYPNAWLDTQNNEKVRENEDGTRSAFVKEKGRNWYTRLPEADCHVVEPFIEERKSFWDLTQNAWDQLLQENRILVQPEGPPLSLAINGGPFVVHPDGKGGRKMHQYRKGLEQTFVEAKARQSDSDFRKSLSMEIRKIIGFP
jgi:hypothetical protein